MPVGISSAARNLFLLGSSGADVVTNFFKAIDQSSGSDDGYITTGLGVGEVNVAYLGQSNYNEYHLSGTKTDGNSKIIGWVDKRQEDGTLDWNAEVNETGGNNVLLNDLYLDANHTGLDGDHEVIVCGSAGSVPFVSKYDRDGVVIWSATSQTADVTYNGVTSSSEAADGGPVAGYEGDVYACGNTDINGSSYAVVEKFNGATGAPDWGKRFTIQGSDVALHAIDTQPRGEYVVAGGYLQDTNNNFKGYFVKIDSASGDIIWDRTLELTDRDWGTVGVVEINDVCVDDNGFIYVVGAQFNGVSGFSAGFICKYTPEGNMLWQKETAIGGSRFDPTTSTVDTLLRWRYNRVKVDTQTGQIIILGSYHEASTDEYGVLIKYSSAGKKIFERIIESTEASPPEFGTLTHAQGGMALDADPSFYYVLFTDQELNTGSLIPNKYTFGKVSSSGNGLGAFSYDTGDTNTIEYLIHDIEDRIGRLSDGSVRNDTSDLATNILNPTKIMFDDYATPITNKKRQMDRAGDFVISGSPAIRPVDFQELNLLGDVIPTNESIVKVSSEIKTTSTDGASGDQLRKIAVGNDRIIAGVPLDDDNGNNSGSTYIFDLNGNQLGKITSSDGAANDFFGDSVAVGSNKIVVGAYSAQVGSNPTQGAAYIYDLDGTNEIKITASDGAAGDRFGSNVAVGNDRIVVTAPFADAIYIFDLTGSQLSKITNTGFGSSVAVGNNKIVVGVAGNDTNANNAGAVYTYDIDGTNESIIYASDGAANDFFGSSVAVGNNKIVVGSDTYLGGATANAAYIYDLDGTNEIKITAPDPDASDDFGHKVAIGSNKIVVSARYDEDNGFQSGAAYIYDLNGNQLNKITASDGAAGYSFGYSVAAGNGRVVITSPFINSQQGAVYIYPIVYSAIDQSGKGNDGAVDGATHNAAGYWEFDGVNDNITIPYTPNLAFTDAILSCEAWIYADTLAIQSGANQEFSIINKRGNNVTQNTNRPYVLGVNGDGRIRWILDGATTVCDTATGLIQTGQWYHIAATHDGTDAKIYVNGVLNTTQSSGTSSLDDTGDIPTRIGWRYRNTSINYNDGRIGEVRVYPRALSAQAVFQNYNATKTKYTNELPEVAPKVGPGIVYGSELLLNYDFGNAACITKNTIRDRDITTDPDPDDYLDRNELASTELLIESPIGDKGDFFGRAVASADGIVAVSDDVVSHDAWFNGITSRNETPGSEVYLYNFGDAVDRIGSDNSAYEADFITTIRPPGTYWNREVAKLQGSLSVGDGRVVFSCDPFYGINVVENEDVTPMAYVAICDYRGNVLKIIHDPNTIDNARQLTPIGYNAENLDLEQGVWVRDSSINTGFGHQARIYKEKIYVADNANEKIFIYTLAGDLITSIGIPAAEDYGDYQAFGTYISLNDDILAVGASNDERGDPVNFRGCGSVYLFNTNDLSFIRKILPSVALDRGDFGEVLEIGHNRIVVGQPETFASIGTPVGHVELFDYDGNFISRLDTVNNIGDDLGSQAESSFAITDKYVFVGYAQTGRGQVNVFDRVTGAHQGRIDPRIPLGETTGNFGRSMTTASNGYDQKLIVGNTKSEGKIYYYDLTKRETGTTVKNLSNNTATNAKNNLSFVGDAFVADGALQCLDYGANGLEPTLVGSPQQFTIEIWLKMISRDPNPGVPPNDYQRVVYSAGVSGNVLLIEEAGNVSFRVPGSTDQNNFTTSAFGSNNANYPTGWKHIVCTYDQVDRKTYVDNGGPSTFNDPGATVNWGSTVGQGFGIGDINSAQLLDVNIGEVRFYTRALTAAEVSKNYNATRARYGV